MSRWRAALVALFLAPLSACSQKDAPMEPPPPAAILAPAPKETATAPTLNAAAALLDPKVEPPREPPSLRGKKVLHVGDSMVGGSWGLTRALEAKLEPEGAKIVRHTKVSETLASMDRDPALKDLLRKHEPDIVIVTLGTNDTDVPHPEVYARHVENIAKRIAPRECWWMGPPTPRGKAVPGVVAVIRDHSAPCRFFDSSALAFERGKDGIHPTDKGGVAWADEFWASFRSTDPKP